MRLPRGHQTIAIGIALALMLCGGAVGQTDTVHAEMLKPRVVSSGATGIQPRDACISVVAEMLRTESKAFSSPGLRNQLKLLLRYEAQEATCRERRRAWLKLSPEERATETARRVQLVHAKLQEMAEYESSEAEEPAPELGITNGAFPPDVVGKGFRLTKNSWEGYVGDQLFDAAGTAYVDNPKQGVVFVMKRGDITSIDTYDTPTATGPVEIVSVQGIILTLKSAAGTYRANDPADGQLLGIVKAPGGATYHFNLETRRFQ
jgi:hypothetical protein